MQVFFNKKFRNRFTESMYVDDYLRKPERVEEMKAMGIDVYPRDENDIFVPTDKNTPRNLEMVEETVRKEYGLK